MSRPLTCVFLAALCGLALGYEERHLGHYTDEFGVEISGNVRDLERLAEDHRLVIKRQLNSLGNVFVLSHRSVSHRSRRSAEDIIDILKSDPKVSVVEQQQVLHRTKRRIVHDKQWELPISRYDDKSVYQRYTEDNTHRQTKDHIPAATGRIRQSGFNDPYFPDQWYLVNEGQTGGTRGYDVNVLPVWQRGFTGAGVVVSILDDGIDHSHPDLTDNYDPEASADMNDRDDEDNDPMPNAKDSSNSHGTRCAGEVAAAANNSNCGVGIAYNAHIGGVRMLDGTVTDLLEAEALTYKNQYIDIYSASWGPSDDGKTMEGPGVFAQQALHRGVTEGRGGLGSIYVWATGNGGLVEDDCSCDGYVSSIYTLSVGCISDHGLSTYFSEVCPSTMAVIFTGGAHSSPGTAGHVRDNPKIKVVTTDLHGDCTLEFQGTSSAAPLAAGCFALVLEANPSLTWRDMQHIVVVTARIPNAEEAGWTVNGAGYHVNHKFGFGAIDCGKMVEVAQSWTTVGEQHRCNVAADNQPGDILAGETLNQTLQTSGCHGDHSVTSLEHTQVHVRLSHAHRGDLSVKLYSPGGTVSEILSLRPLDESTDGVDFTFMTVHNWGEDPAGAWTLSVSDLSGSDRIFQSGRPHQKRGTLESWSLILWGTAGAEPVTVAAGLKRTDAELSPEAHEAHTNEVKDIMASEEQASDNVQIVDQSQEALGEADLKLLSELFNEEEEKRRTSRVQQRYYQHNQPEKLMDRLLKSFVEKAETPTNHHRKDEQAKHHRKVEYERRNYHRSDGNRDYHKRQKPHSAVDVNQRSLLDDAINEYFPPKEKDKPEDKQTLAKHSQTQLKDYRKAKDEEMDELLKQVDELLEILERDETV